MGSCGCVKATAPIAANAVKVALCVTKLKNAVEATAARNTTVTDAAHGQVILKQSSPHLLAPTSSGSF